MTCGQNSSFNNLINVLQIDPEHAGGLSTKNLVQVWNQVLEMQNGSRFIFGLFIFSVTVFHCFCGQVVVALLKCFFIHFDCPIPTPKAVVKRTTSSCEPTRMLLLGPGFTGSSFLGHCLFCTSRGLWSRPVVRGVKAPRDKVFTCATIPRRIRSK